MRRRRDPDRITVVDRFLAGGEAAQARVGGRLAGAALLCGPVFGVGGAAALIASPLVDGLHPVGCLLVAVIGAALCVGLVRLGERLIAEELRQGGEDG